MVSRFSATSTATDAGASSSHATAWDPVATSAPSSPAASETSSGSAAAGISTAGAACGRGLDASKPAAGAAVVLAGTPGASTAVGVGAASGGGDEPIPPGLAMMSAPAIVQAVTAVAISVRRKGIACHRSCR